MRRTSPSLFCSLILAAALLAGCSAPTHPRVLWPPLPDQPRLEWINVYYSEDSFPKTDFERFMEGIVGKGEQNFFGRPAGIASDGERYVFVSDTEQRQVKVYDFAERKVSNLAAEPLFNTPLGLALDSRGRLFVADGMTKNVKVFRATPPWPPLFAFGTPEQFDRPAYLAINDRLGRVYVSDGLGHKVVVFDLEGKHLFSFGEAGTEDGMFFGPQGLAIDGQGRVFVADQYNARIQAFDADGKFLHKFGVRGDDPSQFEMPKDLAFDSEGNLHIIDARKASLLTYAPDGQFLLGLGGKPTPLPVGFALPAAIAIDRNDRIYIVDSLNKRFAVWQYINEAYLSEHPFDVKTAEEQERLLKELEEKRLKEKSGEKK